MPTVFELHQQAMRFAQDAYVARCHYDPDRARQLAEQALLLELQAIALLPEGDSAEPTRSILYESAASLAIQAASVIRDQD